MKERLEKTRVVLGCQNRFGMNASLECGIKQTSRASTFTQVCYNATMNQTYTAIIKQDANWWIGWIEEVPGVNCQEDSREALLTSLRETLIEALEFNRNEAIDAAGKGFEELSIAV